ncbi:patatin-like phospholipase family protein [Paraburkholderia sediminicola]|uniref:patatin-like phospholipase family protein n=1 Tax=Paraburkholderia sediminicola TaxID=458836 RepID=UPI0038BC00A2
MFTKCIHWAQAHAVSVSLGSAAVALMANLAGCAPYPLSAGVDSYYSTAPNDDPSKPLVGLALSGGGNRSAVYASYVIELLGSLAVATVPDRASGKVEAQSFLDQVQYISSVSGGGFAAAYFGTHFEPDGYTPLVTSQQPPSIYAADFSDFHRTMRHNWERPLLFGWGELVPSSSNASRLVKAVDKSFLNKTTFGSLFELENRSSDPNNPYARKAAPRLIFNATNYNNGRRFVMTTIPQAAFCLNIHDLIESVLEAKGKDALNVVPSEQNESACQANEFTPDGFDNIQLPKGDITRVQSSNFELAQAVVTSGAFPVVVGPIAYKVEALKGGYLHLVDGGVTDNSGIESIAQLFLKKLKDPDNQTKSKNTMRQTGLILEINAGLPFDGDGGRIVKDSTPWGTMLHDPGRPTDIQESRVSYYRHVLWMMAKKKIKEAAGGENNPRVASPVSRLDIMILSHTEIFVGLSAQDTKMVQIHICSKLQSVVDVRSEVSKIPTRYKSNTEGCGDADLLRLAACWSIHRHAGDIRRFFSLNSPTPPNAVDIDSRVGELCPEIKDVLPLPLIPIEDDY